MSEYYGEPRYPIGLFGDGLECGIFGFKEITESDGTCVAILKIKPTEALITKFDIKEKDRDNLGFIERKYKIEFVHRLNQDPRWGRILIMCDYLGRPTPLTQLYITYTEAIRGLRRENAAHKSHIAYIYYILKKSGGGMEELNKILLRTQKAIIPVVGRQKDDEEELHRPAHL